MRRHQEQLVREVLELEVIRLFPGSKISREKNREVLMSRVPEITIAIPGIRKVKIDLISVTII